MTQPITGQARADQAPPVRDHSAKRRWVGQSIRRVEDRKFLLGRGGYIADRITPGTLHAAVLRSPHPHARIVRFETAEALAAPGVRAVITGAEAAELCDPMPDFGPVPVGCDVCDEASVAAMAGQAERLGPVRVVVANAGIASPTAPLHEITLADWRETIATDLDGVFLTFRAFIPAMIERRDGSLIAISSMTGKRPLPGRTPYAAAKMGVIGLVRTLAAELGPHGVRVNAICPGAVTGPRIEDVLARQAEARGITEGGGPGRDDRAVAAAAPGAGRGGGRGLRVPGVRRFGRGHRRGPQRHRRRRHVLISPEGA